MIADPELLARLQATFAKVWEIEALKVDAIRDLRVMCA